MLCISASYLPAALRILLRDLKQAIAGKLVIANVMPTPSCAHHGKKKDTVGAGCRDVHKCLSLQ